MARRRKKIVPEIMRPQRVHISDVSEAEMEYHLRYRWYYHQAAAALDMPLYCPRQRCRRLQACLSFESNADFHADPMKLYPSCIRNYDAACLVQSTLDDIIKRAEANRPGNALDPAYALDFVKAARAFSRSRLEAAKAAAQKAAAEAERQRLLREKQR